MGENETPRRALRVGTRGSPMALRQTAVVQERLVATHPQLATPGAVEIVTISTTGDRVQNRLLAEIGGKGLFAKEIEEALLASRIDLAVHSLKDLETWLSDGLVIACVLPRDDPRDVFVSSTGGGLASLPPGATIGTASLRRQAQLLRHRRDLSVVPIRGNVNTRIRKMEAGEVDGLVLALCGLERLDLGAYAAEILPREVMLPAVGQGALAIECRADDETVRRLVSPLEDRVSAACVRAERAMLAALDGSCRTPIAGLAEASVERLTIEGRLLMPDGSAEIRGTLTGGLDDAAKLGAELGKWLRDQGGPDFGLA
jgi:hydroxymethylbilane synthase